MQSSHPRFAAAARGAILSLLLAGALHPSPSRAVMRHVPEDYPGIQAAIDASASGDTVLIATGIYPGGIDLRQKDLVVAAVAPGGVTIDAGGENEGIYCGGQTPATLITGLTIVNATSGIHVNACNPTITYCTLQQCSVSGIFCNQSTALIQSCSLIGNTGSGIRLSDSATTVDGCAIISNIRSGLEMIGSNDNVLNSQVQGNRTAGDGGGIDLENSSPILTSIVITGNESDQAGGGIYCGGSSSPHVSSCTISRNDAAQGGGMAVAGTADPVVSNTILWGNCAGAAGGRDLDVQASASASFECCDVDLSGVSGGTVTYQGTMVYADPRFCAMAPCSEVPTTNGDYELASDSPDLGGPCLRIGVYGQGCAETPVAAKTWGGIRQLFR
jgi:hypothetical protein